ncbi:MAG TPA: FapA family protein [Thermotogota bacterium]|nr:FapA family protein [Thermotogota bacterium]HRW91611.1 FapA family protein [Thermotogota bacterium]
MSQKRIEVQIDSNKLNAFLVFHPVAGFDKPLSSEEVLDALRVKGIKFGADQEKLKQFLENPVPDVPFPFAKGIPPEESKDAQVLFNFDLEKLKLFSAGKMRGTQKKNFQRFLVKKGTLLVRRIAPKQGLPGKDVFGMTVPPRPPKDKTLNSLCGENTRLEDGGDQLLSTSEGILKWENDHVSVQKVFVVSGDVDAGLGNVEFEGTIIVEGMVKPGFVLKAKETIEVSEIVEAATLIAGKDILVHAGVKGRGKAYLSAGRDIQLKFVENAELEAGRDVLVESAAVNSSLKAKRDVKVVGKPGEIIGGMVSAAHQIHVNVFGSEMNVKTTVEVGVDPELREKIALLKSQIAVDQENLQKLNTIVKKLREFKNAMGEKFPKDKVEFLLKSINSINTINVQLPQLENELAACQRRLDLSVKGARIVVREVMNAGTEITIRDRKFYSTRVLKKVILVLEDDEIRVGGYSE